jgi:hypothetical protein
LRPLRRNCCPQSSPSREITTNKNLFKRLFNYLTKDWITGFSMYSFFFNLENFILILKFPSRN